MVYHLLNSPLLAAFYQAKTDRMSRFYIPNVLKYTNFSKWLVKLAIYCHPMPLAIRHNEEKQFND